MKSFRQFLIEYEIDRDEYWTTPSKEKPNMKILFGDSNKKDIKNLKANIRRWEKQYYNYQTPKKRRELFDKISDAKRKLKSLEK